MSVFTFKIAIISEHAQSGMKIRHAKTAPRQHQDVPIY
jgi:hypothetical protein